MAQFIDENALVNKPATQWGEQQAAQLRAALGSLNVGQTGKLLKAIKPKFHFHYGEIDRISFQILRYGIMVEKGVGRGVKMKNGQRINSAKHNGDAIKRVAKPWISSTLNEHSIKMLADAITVAKADAMVKNFTI